MLLTAQQEQAKTKILEWYGRRADVKAKFFLVTGEAGTGKTTLISNILKTTNIKCVVATYTGKAASVLRDKGVKADTIHSTIYKPMYSAGKMTFKRKSAKQVAESVDLIIIDEISMVGKDIFKDLLSLKRPILAFGDFRQLPPVSADYQALKEKDASFRLTEVHRQALESNILRYARALIEKTNYVENPNSKDLSFIGYADINKELVLSHDIVICGMNATREHYNREIRKILGYTGVLQPGEKIIITRNIRDIPLYNGEIFTVREILHTKKPGYTKFSIEEEDVELSVPTFMFTGDPAPEGTDFKEIPHQATYGYCITCHKSQGSTFHRVLVLDESDVFRAVSMNWLYTAVTRAATKLTICFEEGA